MAGRLRVAACHVSPVFLSASKTTSKCVALIQEACRNSADLVIFAESYIPAFPIWSSVLPPTDNHDFFARMAQESVYIDGDEVKAICQAAKEHSIYVSVGISEKVRYSSATLFNTNLIIGPAGSILVHHRKLMPTFFEKLTWSPGDGHGLSIVDMQPSGCKLGALICGENTNPLARYALMAQGEQLHISTWPAIWPTRKPARGMSGSGGGGEGSSASGGVGANYDNVTANRTRAAAHCFEAKCFGVLCAGHLDHEAVDALASTSSNPTLVADIAQASSRGATMFLDPTGALLRGFVMSDGEKKDTDYLQDEEGILYADLNLADCIEGKQFHDVVGGYQRLDVFDFKVDRTRREPATFVDGR